jgi:hypothetical protein
MAKPNHERALTTRRALLAAAAASPLAACATTGGSKPTPLSQSQAANFTLYPKIIDTASDARPHLASLASLGVWTVFRYYAREKQDFLPEKRLRVEEARDLIEAGFSIGSVYQYFNNVRENITAERGRADAEYAAEHASVDQGQPRGSAIYFGVDGDWVDAEARSGMAAYFTSVRRALEPAGYRVGVYGSGATLAFLEGLSDRLVDLFWLAYPPAWSGASTYFNAARWSLFQCSYEGRAGSLAIDADMANPRFADFGQWGAQGVDYRHPALASDEIIDARRFVAKRSARLRIAPDDGASIIDSPRFRKGAPVRALSVASGWAELDVNESGARTGYAKAADLTADLSRRPDYHAADA